MSYLSIGSVSLTFEGEPPNCFDENSNFSSLHRESVGQQGKMTVLFKGVCCLVREQYNGTKQTLKLLLLRPFSYITVTLKQCRPLQVFSSDMMWFCVCEWTQTFHQSPQSVIYSLRGEANTVHTCGHWETAFGYVTLAQQVNVQSLVRIMFHPSL